MVDKTLILKKCAEIEAYLDQIREYENVSVEEYVGDWKVQRIIERTLQIMIETCLDIAGHIISDEAYRIPKNYADTFKVLHENTILSDSLNETMQKMARFRNLMVHHYDKTDPSIVVTILNKNLEDFISYKNAIIAFMKNKEEE